MTFHTVVGVVMGIYFLACFYQKLFLNRMHHCTAASAVGKVLQRGVVTW